MCEYSEKIRLYNDFSVGIIYNVVSYNGIKRIFSGSCNIEDDENNEIDK